MVVIGTLQGITIICGAFLRPIVIKPTSQTETEQKITCSLPGEQVQGFGCSGDSVVQSLEPEQGLKSGMELQEVEPLQNNPKQQDNASKNRLLDLTVLKEGSFLCYSAFGLFATLGFFAPQLYVVELSASLGTERDKAAYMLSTMAISEIFGRLSIGWIMNWGCIRKIFVLLICVSLMCLVLVLFTIVNGFWGLVVCCLLYGFLLGNIASTHIPMLAEDDVVGIQRMPLAVGVYVCIQSFAGLAGPPLGGTNKCFTLSLKVWGQKYLYFLVLNVFYGIFILFYALQVSGLYHNRNVFYFNIFHLCISVRAKLNLQQPILLCHMCHNTPDKETSMMNSGYFV